jgi:uncharacterized protein YndB with AHSA1/START domain
MLPSHIERDILIDAPVETVWRAVTEPDQVSRWFSDAAEIDVRAGGAGSLTWNDRATSKPMTVQIIVEAVEPRRRFSYRWVYPEGAEPREGNSLLVEFLLTAEGEKTRLRVVESGLPALDWPDDEKAKYADEHDQGWVQHLDHLRDFLARSASRR